MSDVVVKSIKNARPKIDDKEFIKVWMSLGGDVRKISETLQRTEQSVTQRGRKYIMAGVKLCPATRTRKPRKLVDKVLELNALISEL